MNECGEECVHEQDRTPHAVLLVMMKLLLSYLDGHLDFNQFKGAFSELFVTFTCPPELVPLFTDLMIEVDRLSQKQMGDRQVQRGGKDVDDASIKKIVKRICDTVR